MVASPLTGLAPMLADKGEQGLSTLVRTHCLDEKLDGLRAFVANDGQRIWLRGRNGADLLPHFPEIEDAALVLLPPGWVLDGEITTTTFEDVNHRAMLSPQRIRLAGGLNLATFNAFDVLRAPFHDDVTMVPWYSRRIFLDSLGLSGRFRVTTTSLDPGFFDEVKARGGEGVIAKRMQSRYTAGRSRDWLKYKATHRVTCIAYAYDAGSGSRAEFGAVRLALVDETGTVHEVGRAGSGFNARSLAEVKGFLDAGSPVVVEIECLGLTTGTVLRQPVFKGVRSDLTLHDATTAQLDNLPKG